MDHVMSCHTAMQAMQGTFTFAASCKPMLIFCVIIWCVLTRHECWCCPAACVYV